jgi:hypothetical protein
LLNGHERRFLLQKTGEAQCVNTPGALLVRVATRAFMILFVVGVGKSGAPRFPKGGVAGTAREGGDDGRET